MWSRPNSRITGAKYNGLTCKWNGRSGMYNAVQSALSPIFSAQLTTSAVPEISKGSSTPTFTRALTTKSIVDFEGIYRLILANEVGFSGARRVENLVLTNTSAPSGSGYTNDGTTVSTNTITASAGTANHWTYYSTTSTPAAGTFQYQCRAKAGTASWLGLSRGSGAVSQGAYFNLSTGTIGTIAGAGVTACMSATADSAGYYLCVITITGQQPSFIAFEPHTADGQALNWNAAGETVLVKSIQISSKVGVTNVSPDEYISKGDSSVAASPAYHGACVDGVKYFSTLNGNTVASNVVTEATGAAINSSTAKFGVLPGVSGSYFSTPSTTSLKATTSCTVISSGVLNTFPPAASTVLGGQYTGSGSDDTVAVLIDTSGKLQFYAKDSTLTTRSAVTTSAVPITAGVRFYLKSYFVLATAQVTFSYSADGVTWTDIETKTVTNFNGTMNTPNGTALWVVGAVSAGTSWLLNGRMYQFDYYVDGVLTKSFNPNLSTTAQTFTAATGEVWTSNGTARIFGNTHTTYGIPAPWDASGPVGYNAEPQAINLCLQSQTFGTTWSLTNVTVTADQVVAPDGTTTADKVEATATAGTSVNQSITVNATSATYSIYVKQGSGATDFNEFIFRNSTTATNLVSITVNYSTGAITYLTGTNEATMTALPNNWWRLAITKTTGITSGDSITVYAGATGNAVTAGKYFYPWGAQLETGSVATSPITTTTVAVTRNADLLSYATSGNINAITGSCICEAIAAGLTSVDNDLLRAGGNNEFLVFSGASGTNLGSYDGTNFPQVSGAATVIGNVTKCAATWGGGALNVYQNTTTTAGSFDGNMSMGATLTICNNGVTTPFIGNIRDLRFYSVKLTAAQVAAL